MGNANSGGRPQPTSLKMLRGNPGQRKLNINEPLPPAGELERPVTLSVGAVAMWEELAPMLVAMGTLTAVDVRPFAALCELQATFTACAQLKDTAPSNFSAKLERETATALRPFYEYFGMTPSARARISVPKRAEEPQSKWAGALK